MQMITWFYPDGSTKRLAVDLITDHWEDYQFHVGQAQKLDSEKEHHGANRSIRSALWGLYSHLDGVVVGLHTALSKSRTDFRPKPRRDRKEFCLRDKIGHLGDFARNHLSYDLPYLRLRYKPLRDLLAHPSLSKRNQEQFLQLRLYLISPAELAREGREIERWLDRLCRSFKFQRLADTKKWIEHYAKRSGGTVEIKKI